MSVSFTITTCQSYQGVQNQVAAQSVGLDDLESSIRVRKPKGFLGSSWETQSSAAVTWYRVNKRWLTFLLLWPFLSGLLPQSADHMGWGLATSKNAVRMIPQEALLPQVMLSNLTRNLILTHTSGEEITCFLMSTVSVLLLLHPSQV